jgi:hypothetical protein
MELKIINRKIVKQGESHFVYIPKAYFDNGQLNIDEIYEIILIPQKKVSGKSKGIAKITGGSS